MKDLRHSLIDYSITMLRAIAQGRGIELATNRRSKAVDQLVRELLQPEAVNWIVERLAAEEREALEAVVAAGGRMKAHLFTHRYGGIRPLGDGRLEWERPWLAPATPAEHLWYLGLIFKAFDEVEGYRAEFIYVPDDVLLLLPQPKEPPPVFSVKETAPPAFVREGSLTLVWDVFAFLCYLQAEEIKLLRDGRLPRRVIERLNEHLMANKAGALPRGWGSEQEVRSSPRLRGQGSESIGAERGYLAFLVHLCRILELVQVRDDGLLKPNPPQAKVWLKRPRWEQLAALGDAWRNDWEWNELWRVRSLQCENTGWRNDPLLARHKVLGYLGRCPPGRWLSLASFIQVLKAIDPDFQRPDGDYTSWYIREAATGRYLMGFEHWDRVEGALITYLISEPLRWLGMVSLGHASEEEETPLAFLITSWGAAFLGLSHERPEGTSPPPLTVGSDFVVFVPAGTDLYRRFQLERFATPQVRGEEAIYRITQRSLAHAREQGITIPMILAFLRRASDDAVPPNVIRALRRWEDKPDL